MNEDTEYSKYPEHELVNIKQEVLDSARTEFRKIAELEFSEFCDPMYGDPIADSIVQALLPYIHNKYGGRAE